MYFAKKYNLMADDRLDGPYGVCNLAVLYSIFKFLY